MTDILYLDAAGAIALNSQFSRGGLRDRHALVSAVGEPRQGAFGTDFYPTLDDKAAALFRGLARNHPFVDGNKRTALTGTGVFLQANGFGLEVDTDPLVRLTLDVAQGHLELPDIAAALSRWRVPIQQIEKCPLNTVVQVLAMQ